MSCDWQGKNVLPKRDPCESFASQTFLELTDTPNSYAGKALFGVRVNASETGLEFFPAAASSMQAAYDAGPNISGSTNLTWTFSGTAAVTMTGGAGTSLVLNGFDSALLNASLGVLISSVGDVLIVSASSNVVFDSTDVVLQGTTRFDASDNDIVNARTVTFNGVVEHGNMGTTETITWGDGQKQAGTNSANCTLTFVNPPGPCNLTFKLTNGGAFSLTWPASVKWPGGVQPTWTASGVDIVSFFFDGSTYYAVGSLGFS